MDERDRQFMAQLRAEFLDGVADDLSEAEELTLQFEQTKKSELIHQLNRKFHSMKGSTQAIELTEASEILHALESWILRAHKTMAVQEMTTILLSKIDMMRNYFLTLEKKDSNPALASQLLQKIK